MMKLITAEPEFVQALRGIARASLKSGAPSPIGETLCLARWPCTASRALIGGGALVRIESLFAVVLPDLDEKGGGKRWRWVFKPKPCAPCRKSGSGRQKEQCDASLQMRSALDHRQVQGQHMRRLQAPDSSGRAGILLPRRIVRFTATATIAASRRAASFWRGRSTRRTTLRCKE